MAALVPAVGAKAWQQPPSTAVSDPTSDRPWQLESRARTQPNEWLPVRSGYSLALRGGKKPGEVYASHVDRMFDRNEYELIWTRWDAETGQETGSTMIDPLPLGRGMHPRLNYIPLIRSSVAPDQNKLCFTRIAGGYSQLLIVDVDGNLLGELLPYGLDVPIDEVHWFQEDRILTVGDGRLTVWSYPDLQPTLDIDGAFRSPAAVAGDGSWCAVSRGNRLDLVNLSDGSCYGHCWNPIHDCELFDVEISPQGKLLASTYRYRGAGPASDGTHHWSTVVWDLERQAFSQLPASLKLNRDHNRYEPSVPCVDPRVRWVDDQHLAMFGAEVILTHLPSAKMGVLRVPYQHWVNEPAVRRVVKFLDGEVIAEPGLPKATYRVCANFPTLAQSKKIAQGYAELLRDRGHQIGTGGSTVYLTAAFDDQGIRLRSKEGDDYLPTPRVTYAITVLDPSGNIVQQGKSTVTFLADKSKYYTGVELGNSPTDFAEWYELPPDYMRGMVTEILDRGHGIVPRRIPDSKFESEERGEDGLRFRIPWQPIPRGGIDH